MRRTNRRNIYSELNSGLLSEVTELDSESYYNRNRLTADKLEARFSGLFSALAVIAVSIINPAAGIGMAVAAGAAGGAVGGAIEGGGKGALYGALGGAVGGYFGGGALMSASASAASAGTSVAGKVIATAAGKSIIAGSASTMANKAEGDSKIAARKAQSYNEINRQLQADSAAEAMKIGGVSPEELRRRAALSDAKNNMTNVLSGASSDSSGSFIKNTLGGTDLNYAVIG